MLGGEESLDHRSLLPRRLVSKAQIAPTDKRKNRRSLELQYDPPECPKRGLLISKTTDSLTNSAETLRKVIQQDSTDSLKKSLLKTADSLTSSIDKKERSFGLQGANKEVPKIIEDKVEEEGRKISSSEQAKKLFFLKGVDEPCSKRGLLAPVSEEVTLREERARNTRSWYGGYGTLPVHTPDNMGARGSPGAPRRALEQLLAPGLRSLAHTESTGTG